MRREKKKKREMKSFNLHIQTVRKQTQPTVPTTHTPQHTKFSPSSRTKKKQKKERKKAKTVGTGLSEGNATSVRVTQAISGTN